MTQEKQGEIVYRKRIIETDGTPKADKFYITDAGACRWNKKAEEWFDEKSICKYVTYWLEPVALSTLIDEVLPTEEDIQKLIPRISILDTDSGDPIPDMHQRDGARMIIELIKSKLINK